LIDTKSGFQHVYAFLAVLAATTHDYNVFSFHTDNSPCHGFEEVLACYRNVVPHLRLSGPTSFAPIVEAAVDIVDRTGGQYHVLVIVADGQVPELNPKSRQANGCILICLALCSLSKNQNHCIACRSLGALIQVMVI
jgi:hypothetical protein